MGKTIKILTMKEFEKEVIRLLQEIKEKPTNYINPLGAWTDNKIDLIELSHLIKKSINHGDIATISIIRAFEYLFNTKLDNPYSRFKNEIETRKKENTGYLQKMQGYYNTIIEDIRK